MTRDEDVKTIREALTWMKRFGERHLGEIIKVVANDSLAALDRLSADLPQDARELGQWMQAAIDEWIAGPPDKRTFADVLAPLIVADRERLLREAAARAEIFYREDCGGCGEFEAIHAGCIGAIESGDPVLTKYAYACDHIKALSAAILGDKAAPHD